MDRFWIGLACGVVLAALGGAGYVFYLSYKMWTES
jgi:flagellar basal body-associated protein FliL